MTNVPPAVSAPALIALFVCACAPASPPPPDVAGDRTEIEGIITDYERAVNDGDLEAAVQIFAPDAVLMPAGGRAQRGIDAIRAYYQNVLLQSPLQLAFAIADVEIVGDLAWVTAEIDGTQTTSDGTANPVAVNGLFVFGRDPTVGDWRVAAYTFTPSGR